MNDAAQPRNQMREMAQVRRAGNRIGAMHHHAFMVRDMEETRRFYEDILELPLIGTWVERVNPVTSEPDNYVHTFFELNDGSCLAFFQFKSAASSAEQSVNKFTPINPFAHHIALTVDGHGTIEYFRKRLADHGVDSFLTDHGYCYSMYFHDPNGLQLELTTHVPASEQLMYEASQGAHEALSQWMREEDTPSNNMHRGQGWVQG